MKTETLVIIENIIVTLSFTLLAIIFNHWWIVLFAILGYTTLKRK